MNHCDEELHKAVALFRYGLIADVLRLPPAAETSGAPCTRRPSAPTPSPAPGAPASPSRRCAIG